MSWQEYFSLILAVIGLPLAFTGVYFPDMSERLEGWLSSIAYQRRRPPPEWKLTKFSKNSVVRFFVMYIPYQLAGAVFWVDGFSQESFFQFLLILVVLSAIFWGIVGLGYTLWFLMIIMIWPVYIVGYSLVKFSRWLNPQSEVIPGVGVLLALSSFFLSIGPFL